MKDVNMDWFLRSFAMVSIVILCLFQSYQPLEAWQFVLVIAVLAALGGFTGVFDWFKSWIEARKK